VIIFQNEAHKSNVKSHFNKIIFIKK
jgi:hypothetical protein